MCIFANTNKYKSKFNIMARPIKDTPTLTGNDAKRFRWHLEHPSPVSTEEKERARIAYEMLKHNSPECPLFK